MVVQKLGERNGFDRYRGTLLMGRHDSGGKVAVTDLELNYCRATPRVMDSGVNNGGLAGRNIECQIVRNYSYEVGMCLNTQQARLWANPAGNNARNHSEATG